VTRTGVAGRCEKSERPIERGAVGVDFWKQKRLNGKICDGHDRAKDDQQSPMHFCRVYSFDLSLPTRAVPRSTPIRPSSGSRTSASWESFSKSFRNC
jgi:hypothetical protein